jgi:probable rRNA maturation factor
VKGRLLANAPAHPPAFSLSIQATCGRELVPYLRRNIRLAHALVEPAPVELSIALVGDLEMSRLHCRHLGIDAPTDVLSFELVSDEQGRVFEGEVVICLPQARRQMKVGLKQEVLLCAIHGLLHLCGFDDKSRRGFAAMHRAEDELLSRLGVGRVFDSHSPARRRPHQGAGVRR